MIYLLILRRRDAQPGDLDPARAFYDPGMAPTCRKPPAATATHVPTTGRTAPVNPWPGAGSAHLGFNPDKEEAARRSVP